jgi:hypothetical protein
VRNCQLLKHAFAKRGVVVRTYPTLAFHTCRAAAAARAHVQAKLTCAAFCANGSAFTAKYRHEAAAAVLNGRALGSGARLEPCDGGLCVRGGPGPPSQREMWRAARGEGRGAARPLRWLDEAERKQSTGGSGC